MPLDGDSPHILCADGRRVPIEVQRNRRARRLTLRLDPQSGAVRLVIPQRTPLAEGLLFAQHKAGWIAKQLDAMPTPVPFVEGARVPFLGVEHELRNAPLARRGVWREDGVIWSSGHTAHLARRVADFLRREARLAIEPRARAKAQAIERRITRITLRDTRSRWGSCSSAGGLNFSWRLILAPEPVLDYVVAHEVAHLVHMNHGPRFWKLVERLTPEVGESCAWMKAHGSELLRYG